MAVIIDGKAVSAKLREEIKAESASFEKETGIKPGLAVIIVGEDPASKVYVANKKKVTGYSFLFYTGLLFTVVSIVFLILFYSVYNG